MIRVIMKEKNEDKRRLFDKYTQKKAQTQEQ